MVAAAKTAAASRAIAAAGGTREVFFTCGVSSRVLRWLLPMDEILPEKDALPN
jgi:hypothetical protein